MTRRVRTCVASLALSIGLGSPGALAAAKEEVAVVQTRLGAITFRFFPADAPGHAAYVKELIRRRFYDGTTFHRVIPHFVIQGGDPNSKDADRLNDGDGEADHRLKAEFSAKLHYRPGTVGMARDVDPDSGSCQFFIALENLPRLDGKYTIFGEVIAGLDVARAIADQPRDLRDNPLQPVPMTATLKEMKLPPEVVSLQEGPGGEVLTGPGKPRPYDPGDVRWKAPVLIQGGESLAGAPPIRSSEKPVASGRLDISIDAGGSVLDVRFAELDYPDAAAKQRDVKDKWKFSPALLEGKAVKARFSTNGLGEDLQPSRVPGTPVDAGSENLSLPQILVTVQVPAGATAPAKVPELRLTIDETGQVADVSLQSSCGDAALDEAAMKTARELNFTPARRGKEAVAVYLNSTVKWRESGKP